MMISPLEEDGQGMGRHNSHYILKFIAKISNRLTSSASIMQRFGAAPCSFAAILATS
jgi:hypothetical protein